MKLDALHNTLAQHPLFQQVASSLAQHRRIQLRQLSGSIESLLIAYMYRKHPNRKLVLVSDKEEAAYLYNDLCLLLGDEEVVFLASSYKRSVQFQKIDTPSVSIRADVLERLNQSKWQGIVVAYPDSIMENVVAQKEFDSNTLRINVGKGTSLDDLTAYLSLMGFNQVDFVYEPGQYAVRGGIADVFSFSGEYPFRIEYFGQEIESIRAFNPVTQLSIHKYESVNIIPNIQKNLSDTTRKPIFDFFDPQQTTVWAKDLAHTQFLVQQLYEKSAMLEVELEEDNDSNLIEAHKVIIDAHELLTHLTQFPIVEWGHQMQFQGQDSITFQVQEQPVFNKNFNLLTDYLVARQAEAYQIYLMSDNVKQFDRLREIFHSIIGQHPDPEVRKTKLHFNPLETTLHSGFVDTEFKICVLTDHQIFGRYHKYQLRSRAQVSSKEALTLKEINDLQPGDYVVHVDYGVGRFAGLQRMETGGKTQEVIRLVYKDGDVIFVNIHSLHRISKFKSKDGEPPTIHKLGTATWQKQKSKAKGRIKDIAKELIALYAQRMHERGFSFAADNYLQQELEASFLYEDTPDQYKATVAVKADMESDRPMDRLVCGDVGFGKTEIAIRAAFKAVCDSKQVAILVPTTILAFQHFRTFQKRLAEFPVTIDYVSRLKPAKSQKETIKKLSEGKIDILIGTHRIISKDIKFKDLGLLIVDEEQKFGVGVKEKLKEMRVNVDTLTLTATPIPRTMQFSLMGARDLSIIATAPPNRFPVSTEVHTFSEDIIREAILYEIDRGGQVFFINNRIHNIFDIQALLHRLVPNLRSSVAHGQMEGAQLEKIVLDFIEGSFDVLVATSIIESGLDIPNANTIIISDAHHFGISDLHQLRGRVGRSDRKAFCYLLAPPLSSLPHDARKRLKALEDFSDLGSGFQIAMQDLDIRGAGNLLGAEQSGFIADIGIENFHRILNETIQELKENEFREVFEGENVTQNDSLIKAFTNECSVETDLELYLPETYVQSSSERIKLYRNLDNIENEEELSVFETEILDRFGQIPPESKGLFDVVRLRWDAIKIGVERITLRSEVLVLYFVPQEHSGFYRSETFSAVLRYIEMNPKYCKVNTNKERMSLVFMKTKGITQAREVVKAIKAS